MINNSYYKFLGCVCGGQTVETMCDYVICLEMHRYPFIIDLDDPISWPPRSPDLTLVTFFLRSFQEYCLTRGLCGRPRCSNSSCSLRNQNGFRLFFTGCNKIATSAQSVQRSTPLGKLSCKHCSKIFCISGLELLNFVLYTP